MTVSLMVKKKTSTGSSSSSTTASSARKENGSAPKVDYLGMEISMDDDYVYLFMSKYITTTLKLLEFEDLKERAVPISCFGTARL